jgi:hypothetical protein
MIWKNLNKKPMAYGMIPQEAIKRLQKYRPLYFWKVTKIKIFSSSALYQASVQNEAMTIRSARLSPVYPPVMPSPALFDPDAPVDEPIMCCEVI